MKIAIVDYGCGNLHSVMRAVNHAADGLDASVVISANPEEIRAADRLIWPGQGAMPDCMANVQANGGALRDALEARLAAGVPILGICIGLQLLMDFSEEGHIAGMGILPGRVKRFPSGMSDESGRLKVPQMGWNRVRQTAHPLWKGIPDLSWFYFVHSYYVDCQDAPIVAGRTEYGLTFASALAKDNIFATQFHPEKSARCGLQLFRNFLTWTP